MKLIYTQYETPVQVGDNINIAQPGDPVEVATVTGWREPHKAGSSGRVYVKVNNKDREFFPSVIGAHWIE